MIKVSLSSIIEIISGGTPKTDIAEYWNGNIGWLSVTDFNNDNRYVYSSEKKITERAVKESNTKYLQSMFIKLCQNFIFSRKRSKF
ncbi:MAG: restriction endonuclease subunit S [Crocinitomicaceae bacterium]|nr:restriction endonuclease subunit S [Crocinitomicaceae bacterium]